MHSFSIIPIRFEETSLLSKSFDSVTISNNNDECSLVVFFRSIISFILKSYTRRDQRVLYDLLIT